MFSQYALLGHWMRTMPEVAKKGPAFLGLMQSSLIHDILITLSVMGPNPSVKGA